MKKALSLVIITQAFFILSGCSSLFMKSDPLVLNLEKGSTHILKNESNIQYFTDATMSEEVMTMNLSMMVDYSVTDIEENGTLIIDAKVASVKLKQNMSGMDILYDSGNADSTNEMGGMVEESIGPLINQIVTLKVDKYSEIIKDENDEEAVAGASPASLVGQIFTKLPACELKVGETWSPEVDSTSIAKGVTVYTVSSVDKEKVVFTYVVDNGEVKTDEVDADLQSGGKAIYDRKTGKLIDNTNNSTVKGSNPQMGDFFMVSTTRISTVK